MKPIKKSVAVVAAIKESPKKGVAPKGKVDQKSVLMKAMFGKNNKC